MKPQPHTETTSLHEASSVDSVLRHMLDDLPDGVILLDEKWRLTYANRAASQISRIQPGDLNSKTHWELYPETAGTEIETVYRDVMVNRVERHLEAPYAPFQLWLDLRVVPVPGGIGLYYRDVTKLHVTEQERQAASERLEQVLAATHDGVIAMEQGFRVTYMNRRAHEMLSPGGEIMGQNLFDIFPAAVYENSPYIENYQRTMTERVVTSFEAFYPEPLNLWFNVVAHPSPEGIVVFFRDITKEKTRTEALRDSEEQYRVLAELNPQLLWTTDVESRVLYANQRFLDYIGRDTLPNDGNEYLACFDENDRERIIGTWSHSMSTGQEFAADARLIRSDGISRWWRLRAAPVRDEDGSIQQWLGTAVDIHEERVAAIRLNEQYAEIDRQRRELETIYSGSPIGMALYEPKDLRVLRLNERQSEIIGARPEDAIGKTLYDIAPDFSQAHRLVERAASGEATLNQSIGGVLPNRPGEHRFFNVNYSPIFNEDGTVRAIAAATIETTAQKRAEAALIQSEKLAAVGRMASSIAHEINNPLEAVTNLIYIARQYAVAPEVSHSLELADQELRRVSVIANQTLRFHKQSTSPREITCSELWSTVLSLYEGRFRNSSITVERRKRARSAISCFEGDMRQVLNNLVGNSIDAMPNGGSLFLRSRDATDWRTGRTGIMLTVADTGTGMSPETCARVFDAFFTTKGYSGTGLGLWIGNEIIDRHHGRLLLRSSQNPAHRGTVFSLFLPFQSGASVLTSRIQ